MSKQTDNSQNAVSEFLKTEGGKSKSNAIEIPAINLPKGGGAIRGIDEKFTVNAVNGSAAFSLALPFSPARGASPSLTLNYNSGAGNGIFGLGWQLGLPAIARKTDKKLPQYLDAIDSDIFLFSEAEDLVPEFQKEADGSFSLDGDGNYIIKENDSADGNFTIRFYKPRIEGLFSRIERWCGKTTAEIKWRVISKENVTTLFGWSAASRISDPGHEGKIFEWLPEFVFDDKGNCAHYRYKKEDGLGVDSSLPHQRNRRENGDITYTNLFLEKVLYGNKTPYLSFNDPFPAENGYCFQTVFDYGEYNPAAPFDKINDWSYRHDAFSNYKAGFEIRTGRLCRRVLLFHYFDELPQGAALIKALDFGYDTGQAEGFTFLKSITTIGYSKREDGSYTQKSLPAMEFMYQALEWNQTVKNVSQDDLANAPAGLTEPLYQFADLLNEGVAGILSEQGAGWYYKENLGQGRFAPARQMASIPSFRGLGERLQLMDLDMDGGRQLVNLETTPSGYFELNDEAIWQGFQPFKNIPAIDLQNSHTRLLDLDGDGRPDILITEDQVFTWYESAGREGFAAARQTVKPFDEERGPHLVFSDPLQTIFLADMAGDGLTDIVRIRNGEVCYWPNLGYGRFGAKVTMDQAPVFAALDAFNPAFIRLADIDGSGTSDIIYLGKNKFSCWLNLCGNAFAAAPFTIENFPEIHSLAQVTVTDLLGNGVACIVWSSPLSKDAPAALRYIDLLNSKKPHLMISYKNNLGKEVDLEYAPSTRFYLEDKQAGKPWVTTLHFPVHCLVKTEIRDRISAVRYVSNYRYHHGYYDHAEREFRGFGLVEQVDSEHFEHWVKGNAANIVDQELHQAPVLTKTWFHTGAFLSRDKILSQFADEYWYQEMNRRGYAVVHHEMALPEARLLAAPGITPSFIDELSAQEWREALRACKSLSLRSEVFAMDAPLIGASADEIQKELTPYAVKTHNCVIELLQPKGQNPHAVFLVKESEAIGFAYERNTADPRVTHTLNIQLDEYGNVLESASIAYPRWATDSALPVETRQAQNKLAILYQQNQFTNDVSDENNHRLRLTSETKTYELKGVAKANPYYTVADFAGILSAALTVPYPQMDDDPLPGMSQKRLIEQQRTVFYKNDLSTALPLHQLESLGLPYESFQLAYTPELIADIFGAKVNAALLLEGRFTHSEGDDWWWIRSGTMQLIAGGETVSAAQSRFYLPLSYTDPYGAQTRVRYDANYFLFIEETIDALDNRVLVEQFNYRTLTPQRLKDANENISEVIYDELGLVKATAVYGKGDEADDLAGLDEFTAAAENTLIGQFFNAVDSMALTARGNDLLQHATTRFVYDLAAFQNTGKPAVVATIVREEHYQKNNHSPLQISFEFTNGLGQVVMKKNQAEPGVAWQVTVNPDLTYAVTQIDTAALLPKQLRWIGNGRTILNNKGHAVKQYEPYFSVTFHYEDQKELVETGVTPVLYYDALGRMIKTERPDGTFGKTEFNSWQQTIFDANDTMLQSAWYHHRTHRLIDAELLAAGKDPGREKLAADQTAWLADTPHQLHLDTLGRAVLAIDHNKNPDTLADEFYSTILHLDIEGNLRRVIDARHHQIMQYRYDLLGTKVYQQSLDSGQRWSLVNVLGNPLRTWDERNHEFQYFYDPLHRPLQAKVLGGDGDVPLDHIFERVFYGEAETDPELKNLRLQPVRHFDSGGLVATPAYDFKGQPLQVIRRLFKNYKSVANWIDSNLVMDLESDLFTFVNETDALGRIIRQITPDGSVITPEYNEAGLLNSETVAHADLATTTTYIREIDYNEKGQRIKIIYGNEVTTRFYYDKETFRLNHLITRRKNDDLLQDYFYTFDPMGNITHIEDKAIPLVFFNNQKIAAVSSFRYDALQRLIEANGRENNVPAVFNGQDNWHDAPFMQTVNAGDPLVMRNYTQHYHYDEVGNLLQLQHISAGNTWTRDYTYPAGNNRLQQTQIGAQVYAVSHHPLHGFITAMPHLEELGWNFKEELIRTIRQRRLDGGTPEITYYQYDGQGQRIRKLTENQADPGVIPTKKEERIYLSGYELYRKHSGTDTGLERISLSLEDQGQRFVLIETRNHINDGTEKHLPRYQLHNHLGSSALEIDGSAAAKVISYEEYHPFGTTAFQAKNTAIKSAAKRYRFTGMERDEESGLEYHQARYYLPWLGRWLNADPIGLQGGVNVYAYVKNNPLMAVDSTGTDGEMCGVWDEESMSCYAEPCELQSTPEETSADPVVTTLPPPPPRVRVAPRRRAAPPPAPPPPPAAPPAAETREVSAWQRWGIGGLQLLGCGLEGAITVGLCVAPDPTLLTKVGCGVGAVHTADTCSTAILTLSTGTVTETLTHQLGEGVAVELGATPDQARWAGTALDITASAGPSVAVGVSRRLALGAGEATLTLATRPSPVMTALTEEGLAGASRELGERGLLGLAGHNKVGITLAEGAGTQWSHLAGHPLARFSSAAAPDALYATTTIPVSLQGALRARETVLLLERGGQVTWSVMGPNCATTAATVLRSGGVVLPAGSALSPTILGYSVRYGWQVTATGAAVGAASPELSH
jgi:RHS repeat-associated protein